MAVKGYRAVCASRKKKARGGEALMLRDSLMYNVHGEALPGDFY